MSYIKKQSPLRWRYRNEKTESGVILETVWTAKVQHLNLEVTNCPGTSTLSWRITTDRDPEWWNGSDESRYEHSVSTLKDRLFERAQEILKRNP